MSTYPYYPDLAERVRSQRELQPDLYGDVDLMARPYRLATEPDDLSSLPSWVADPSEHELEPTVSPVGPHS